jgi:hypothetical protein
MAAAGINIGNPPSIEMFTRATTAAALVKFDGSDYMQWKIHVDGVRYSFSIREQDENARSTAVCKANVALNYATEEQIRKELQCAQGVQWKKQPTQHKCNR